MPKKFRQVLAVILPLCFVMLVGKAAAIPENVDISTPGELVGPTQPEMIDRILEVEDYRFTTCRQNSNQTVCANYSVKNWPLNMKGAAFTIEHCIMESEETPLVTRLNEFCDQQWRKYSDKAAFKATFPACWPIWRTAKRVELGTYQADFNASGCKAPLPTE